MRVWHPKDIRPCSIQISRQQVRFCKSCSPALFRCELRRTPSGVSRLVLRSARTRHGHNEDSYGDALKGIYHYIVPQASTPMTDSGRCQPYLAPSIIVDIDFRCKYEYCRHIYDSVIDTILAFVVDNIKIWLLGGFRLHIPSQQSRFFTLLTGTNCSMLHPTHREDMRSSPQVRRLIVAEVTITLHLEVTDRVVDLCQVLLSQNYVATSRVF